MKISDHAFALHRTSLLIDLHADTIIPMKWMGYRIEKKHKWELLGKLGFFHCDIPRFKEGGYAGQFFGLGTFPYPEIGSARSCLRQAEMILRACSRNPQDLEFVTTASKI